LGTNYHPPRLVQIPTKGNKWFVVITKPTTLQGTSSNIQVRRSTGTTDKRKAEAAMPGIATEVYREFDKALDVKDQQAPERTITFLTPDDARADPRLSDPFAGRRMLPPLEPPKDRATKLSRFIPEYLRHLETNQVGDRKERRTRGTRCKEFMNVVGDLHVDEIKKIHAYRYADWMAEKGLANKTIKSAISRVSVLLVRAEKMGIIDANPLSNLSLDDYGRRVQSYLPFDPDEMKAIFVQKMPEKDRLALTLLATTGARLDEIALLNWSQVKREHGITYLDFRTAEKLKNEQSQRVVPVHSKVAPLLAHPGSGRIFDYPKDVDGKAQNAAGKRLSAYVNSITDNPLKVIHSFRGTFKDMLRDAGLTLEMVKQLEGGEVALSEFADVINSNQVSKELNDRITGHAQKDVAGKYGLGPALIPRAAAIEKLSLSFLPE
jgi:integrase